MALINSVKNLLSTKIPLGNGIENLVNFIVQNFSGPLDAFANMIGSLIDAFEKILSDGYPIGHILVLILLISGIIWKEKNKTWGLGTGAILAVLSWAFLGLEAFYAYGSPLLLILIFALIAWRAKGRHLAIFVILGLGLMWNLEMWGPVVRTLSSIVTSVVVALIVGIPVGILKAHSKIIDLITRPILDFMQTIPPFVYLIPALMFFGLGNVSGVIATVVFCIAPPIRLTYLGITQVEDEVLEAGKAFGCNWWQMLYKIELPSALPSIMMGINQCIMLALSMVVIAAMIGAGGLGKPVLRALSVIDIGLGFEAGLGVVIIAMILDRMFGRE